MQFRKNNKIKFSIFIAVVLLVSSCQNTKELTIKKRYNKKVEMMNRALNVCFDTFVLKKNISKISYQQNLKKYQDNKQNSGNIWKQFAKNTKAKYYRDSKIKLQDRNKNLYSLGVRFLFQGRALPPYDNFDYKKTFKRPRYSDVIHYCDQKFHSTKYSKKIENEINDKNKTEDDYAKNLGFVSGVWGYDKERYEDGIFSILVALINDPESLEENKSYLIKRGKENFKVQDIVGNYVIYEYKSGAQSYKIALKMKRSEFYPVGSPLKGKYFAITSNQIFIEELAKNFEIIALKQVE